MICSMMTRPIRRIYTKEQIKKLVGREVVIVPVELSIIASALAAVTMLRRIGAASHLVRRRRVE